MKLSFKAGGGGGAHNIKSTQKNQFYLYILVANGEKLKF